MRLPGFKAYGYLNQNKRNLKIDFVIKAKPALQSIGFSSGYYGVEVKYLRLQQGSGFSGKSSRAIFQSLSYWYSGARWEIPNASSPMPLETVLVFSNFSFEDERNQIFNTLDQFYGRVWGSYLSVANHGNVGELLVCTYKSKLMGWRMHYSGANYFRWDRSDGGRLGNKNLINKARIGNF